MASDKMKFRIHFELADGSVPETTKRKFQCILLKTGGFILRQIVKHGLIVFANVGMNTAFTTPTKAATTRERMESFAHAKSSSCWRRRGKDDT